MAQVIKKRKIVIASVLKPVDDPRMFGKIGLTISASGGFEVHIIGFPGARKHTHPAIFFYSHKYFKRLSLYRLFVPWLTLRQILRIKPEVVIITTHELLMTGFLVKVVTSAKLIYDVQENYFLNILYLNSFPSFIKPVIAAYVRIKERLFSAFTDHFFLAEAGYEKELPFIKKKYSILENKVRRPDFVRSGRSAGGTTQLLFSGTLDETTGVFTAIDLAKKLHGLDSTVRLLLVGYCSRPHVLNEIKEAVRNTDFISMAGGGTLVPHKEVIQAMEEADAGIVAYLPTKATERRTPTKLYEYIGYQLPVLLIDYQPWVKKCELYNAAIPFDREAIDAACILHALKTKKFYTSKPGSEVYWESEEPKLLKALDHVTGNL